MKTIKQFTEKSHIDSKLIRAVIRQNGGWSNFKSIAYDVYDHGANSGFSGFIYYDDTVKFTKNNKQLIIQCLFDLNLDLYGNKNYIETLLYFNCLKGFTPIEILDGLNNPKSDYRFLVFNALAWFALEEVSG